MRNHGRSPHSDEFNYIVMAMDVNEFMLDHEIRSAVLIGHSLGGKVAMHLALDYPHKIQKLIVVDIAPKTYPLPYFETIITTLLNVDLSQVKLRKEVEKKVAEDIPEPGVRKFLMKNLARGKGNNLYWKVNLPTLYANVSALAGAIYRDEIYDNPTLFVRGEKSNYILDEDIPGIKSKFPQSDVVTLSGAGHWLHVDALVEFLEITRDFIGKE
jgi:pimeloyl-ACP methyl ester carboxylesterase